jgi:hypothetical protein
MGEMERALGAWGMGRCGERRDACGGLGFLIGLRRGPSRITKTYKPE